MKALINEIYNLDNLILYLICIFNVYIKLLIEKGMDKWKCIGLYSESY